MNIDELKTIWSFIDKGNMVDAISFCEQKLKSLPNNEFSKIIGNDGLLANCLIFAHVLEDAYDSASSFFGSEKRLPIFDAQTYLRKEIAPISNQLETIFCQLNGFTVNTNSWYVEITAFSSFESKSDLEWLAEPEYAHQNDIVVKGYEEIQSVFQSYLDNKWFSDPIRREARDTSTWLVLLRYQDMIRQAFEIGLNHQFSWTKVHTLAAAYDFDAIYDTVTTHNYS